MVAQGLLPNRMPNDLFAGHPIGWTMQPGLKATIPTVGGMIRVEINQEGFRDDAAPVAGDSERQRILVLGDSYVAAIETVQAQTFHMLLESSLQDRADVIAMGVSGYQTAQELLAYRDIGSRYRPDDVVEPMGREQVVEMRPGDHIHLPPRQRHRVEWTDPAQDTVWLAVHYAS